MLTVLKAILKRAVASVSLLIGVATIVFFLSRLLPGDVAASMVSPTISAEVRDRIRIQFGLDRPLLEQYVLWLKALGEGDLGNSFTRNQPVRDVIGSVLPNTLVLGGAAFVIEVIGGICFALFIYLFHGTWTERLLSHALLALYAVPSFWIGMLLLLVFSYGLGLFPSSQMYSSDAYGMVGSLLHHLVLPACAAATPGMAMLARFLRANLLWVKTQDYVLFARSMGLSEVRIFRSYILPNALAPLISLTGVELGVLMTGVVVTETLFSWPGMGQLTVHAIFARDYPLVSGCVLVAGAVVICGNLLADLAHMLLDPRVRSLEKRR